jgi:WD40 repeat protein
VLFSGKGPARVRVDGVEVSLADYVVAGGWAFLDSREFDRPLLALSPDRRTLAVGGNRGILSLRDASTGKEIAALPPFPTDVAADRLAFSADGKTLVTWVDDVVLWDAATGKERDRYEAPGPVLAVRFAADGRTPATLVLGTRGSSALRLWDVATGETTATLRGHAGAVLTAVWSPDGRVLATAGDDRTVRLWDAVTGQPRGALRGHPRGGRRGQLDAIRHLAFRADGKALAAASENGTVSLWLADATGR